MSDNKIFVSYRRQDASGEAGRLVDHLQEIFGEESVFLDVEAIEAGLDFEQAIDQALNSCKVLLAIIGPHWTSLKDSKGNLRLFEENDFIRLEISAALRRNIRVIPVLVNGADLPSANELPEDLQGLVRRQTHELSNSRWKYDCDQLAEVLLKVIPPKAKPIPNPKPKPVKVQQKSWLAKNYLWLLGAFVILLVLMISSDDFQQGFQEGYNGETASSQEEGLNLPSETLTSINLIYTGDNYGCNLNLQMKIGSKEFAPDGYHFVVSGLKQGMQEFTITGNINCPTIGSCSVNKSGKLEIIPNGNYYIAWNNSAPGTCDISLRLEN